MLSKCHILRYSRMDLFLLKLIVVFIAYLVYDPRSCWTSEESQQDLFARKTLALYRKLKQEPNTSLDRPNLKVAEEDLKPPNVNSSNDLTVILFDQGYLKVIKKPEKPGGLCQLELSRASEMWLYANLVNAAAREDQVVADAISKIETIFKRMPPEIDDFRCLILSLETILNRIPHLFYHWQVAAVFGIFYTSDLNVLAGHGYIDDAIMYCNDLPNNTCMRFVVDLHYDHAFYGWESYYENLLLPGLIRNCSDKNLLAAVASFFPYKHDILIRDWYGQYESPRRQPIREYRPLKS